ncbi:urease accessory protein UreD [Mycobacterium sp. 2YAF39]|uniref:urease accessory protein UreD n=1 Tax=Mycobacterium sp. 2YAF39 TaxID=3233033 RepID=UPI003F947E7D
MRSDVLIVARHDRRPRIESRGGLAARETEPDTVHLVSAAATPIGGDSVYVRIVVEPGALLRVRTAAATMTLPGPTTLESHAIWSLEVAGELDVDPQPTVVAAASRHFTSTRLALDGPGRVRVRERVQIGRSGERQGFWSGSLHADVEGSALLRHRIELGRGSVADDELGAPMACISELHYPESDADTAGMALALARGGCLSTWQGERL